jgi:hypothetical protein
MKDARQASTGLVNLVQCLTKQQNHNMPSCDVPSKVSTLTANVANLQEASIEPRKICNIPGIPVSKV